MKWRLPLLVAAAAPAFAQIAYVDLQPPVIVPGVTQSLLIQARVTQSGLRVVFQASLVPGPDVELKDDGTGGDKVAGDMIYSATIPAAPIVKATTPDMAFRPPIGFLAVFQGQTSLSKYGVGAEIAAPDIPRLSVTSDAADVQHTAYLVNIRMPAAFPPAGGDPSVIPDGNPVLKRFYQLFPDSYDMLNLVYSPSFFQNRFHVGYRNDVQGIGTQIFNSTSTAGSAGALLGVNHFPLTSYFDAGETAFVHEFGHQFIDFSTLPILAQGVPHWPISSLASGVMGFSLPGAEGGRFPCRVTQASGGVQLTPDSSAPVFADMDLYLMGLIPPEQVGDNVVFADQSNGGVIAKCGSLYTGALTHVSIADVVQNMGKRVPDSTASKKSYRVATILVTRDTLLDADAMAFYSYFARRGEEQGQIPVQTGQLRGMTKPIWVATGGRLTVNMQVNPVLWPAISYGGVANGSSGTAATWSPDVTGAVSPGSFVTVYGSHFAAAPTQAPSVNLPLSLGGVTVRVNGQPAPLFYADSGQVNLQLPFETAPGLATVVVTSPSGPSSLAWIRVAPAAPGITVFGANRAAVLNQDNTVNLPSNAAAARQSISIYLTGIGPLDTPVATGQPAPTSTLVRATSQVTVTIGGAYAPVSFAGLSPGATGLAQINATVPNVPPGDYDIVVTVGGVASNSALITVK
jgi:uncharacterized protein (TIGR03437 family)